MITKLFCKTCGGKNVFGSKFCSSCGGSLSGGAKDTPAEVKKDEPTYNLTQSELQKLILQAASQNIKPNSNSKSNRIQKRSIPRDISEDLDDEDDDEENFDLNELRNLSPDDIHVNGSIQQREKVKFGDLAYAQKTGFSRQIGKMTKKRHKEIVKSLREDASALRRVDL